VSPSPISILTDTLCRSIQLLPVTVENAKLSTEISTILTSLNSLVQLRLPAAGLPIYNSVGEHSAQFYSNPTGCDVCSRSVLPEYNHDHTSGGPILALLTGRMSDPSPPTCVEPTQSVLYRQPLSILGADTTAPPTISRSAGVPHSQPLSTPGATVTPLSSSRKPRVPSTQSLSVPSATTTVAIVTPSSSRIARDPSTHALSVPGANTTVTVEPLSTPGATVTPLSSSHKPRVPSTQSPSVAIVTPSTQALSVPGRNTTVTVVTPSNSRIARDPIIQRTFTPSDLLSDMPPLEVDHSVSRTTYATTARVSGRKRALSTNSDTESSSTQQSPGIDFFCRSFFTKSETHPRLNKNVVVLN
jgi:hypothetical protein